MIYLPNEIINKIRENDFNFIGENKNKFFKLLLNILFQNNLKNLKKYCRNFTIFVLPKVNPKTKNGHFFCPFFKNGQRLLPKINFYCIF